MKNHGNVISQKYADSSPEAKHKLTEDCDLTKREFKTAVRKKLSELQESSERHFNAFRNEINEQKESVH